MAGPLKCWAENRMCSEIYGELPPLSLRLLPKYAEVYVQASHENCDMLSQYISVFNALVRVKSFTLVNDVMSVPCGCVHQQVAPGIKVHLKLQGLVQPSVLIEKFDKKVSGIEKKLEVVERKMGKDTDNDKASDNRKIILYRSEIETYQNYIDILRTLEKSEVLE